MKSMVKYAVEREKCTKVFLIRRKRRRVKVIQQRLRIRVEKG